MNLNHEKDDLHRYIESLQRQLHTPGWEEFHDLNRMKDWFAKNGDKFDGDMAPQYGDTCSPTAHIEKLIRSFEAKTEFDSPCTEATFAPILKEVNLAAEQIGIRVKRPIHIVTSTNVAPSPAIRPTKGPHFLFIGLGTSSFCNYWAKAFAAVVKAIAKDNPDQQFTNIEQIQGALKPDPSGVILAARLAFAYGAYGSVIGFGQVIQPASYLSYRLQVLRAMEVFVVSHEFAHLVAEERLPKFQGVLGTETSRELEYFCDHLALQISRHYANHEDNFLAFTGMGAILFFRAMEMSEFAREKLAAVHKSSLPTQPGPPAVAQDDSSHPTLSARIGRIKSLAISLTPDDQRSQVAAFIEEYDLIATSLCTFVKDAFAVVGS
jgi:hypothetical protein